jgi:phosphoglycerate kinase
MRYVQEYNFKGKKALIRVDFNVPLDNRFGVVDDTRIQGVVPTVRQVLDEGGAAVLLSLAAVLLRPKSMAAAAPTSLFLPSAPIPRRQRLIP